MADTLVEVKAEPADIDMEASTTDKEVVDLVKSLEKVNKTVREADIDEDVNQLFDKVFALNGKVGQKSLVKKLWASHEEVLEECHVFTLRKAFWFPEITSCPEGVRLLAVFVKPIGPQNVFRLLQKLISEKSVSNTQCQNYGSAVLSAWKCAEKENDVVLRLEIEEELITKLSYYAIFLPTQLAGKFQQMLIPLSKAKKERGKLDTMVSACLMTTLFRGISSSNNIARLNATIVFFMFYPLVETNEVDNFNAMEEQYKTMTELLLDDCFAIRVEATTKILETLSNFWELMPMPIVKTLMGTIIDKLSNDECVPVRVAVFEGMIPMLQSPSCINACTHALKCILPQGIIDRNDKVRIASLQLLYRLKRHRFINIFDIVSRQEIFYGLELESFETVRRKYVPLIHTMLPVDDNLTEEFYHRPAKNLIDTSRLAALTYYRLVVPSKLISLHSAAEIIKMMIVWAYRVFRVSKKEAEENIKLDEKSSEWIRGKVYIECAIMLYLSIRVNLRNPENAQYKTAVETVGLKLLTEIFNHYKETSLIGTAMVLGSLLPRESLRSISSEVVSMLKEDEIEPCLVEPFLEAAANWNIDFIFNTIGEGLEVLNENLSPNQSPQKKKPKKSQNKTPAQKLEKALGFLKFVLRSFTTNSMVTNREVLTQSVRDFHHKLRSVKETIQERMNSSEALIISDELLIASLETRLTLTSFLLNCMKPDDDEHHQITVLVRDLCSDLRWFEKDITEHYKAMQDPDEERILLFSRLANVVLSSSCHALLCWEFGDTFVEMGDEEVDENCSTYLVSFPQILSSLVISFCSSSTPQEVMFEVFTTTTLLLNNGYGTDGSLFRVLSFAPRWIINCNIFEQETKAEGTQNWEFLDEKKAAEALKQLLKASSDSTAWREDLKIQLFRIISVSLVSDASQSIENAQVIGHPSEHDFVVSKLITIFVHKFVHKMKGLTNELLCSIRELLIGGALVNETVSIDENIVRLAAVAQVTIMSDPGYLTAPRTGKRQRKCDQVESILEITEKVLETTLLRGEPEDNFLLGELRSLLELNSNDTEKTETAEESSNV